MNEQYREISVSQRVERKPALFGPAPQLTWIELCQLVIDGKYQRELGRANWNSIRKIAGAFEWSKFSAVLVAPIEGGRFAVVDGQHRAHAAVMVGIESVPCIVVPMNDVEQAASFAVVNGNTIKVTPFQIYRAALIAEEPWALQIKSVCEAAGCQCMVSNGSSNKNAGDIYSIRMMQKSIEIFGEPAIIAALTALRDSEFGADAEAYVGYLLKIWLHVVGPREWLHERVADLSAFLDKHDVYETVEKASVEARRMKRFGSSTETRFTMGVSFLGSSLDRAYPQRIALPGRPPARKKD